MLFGPKHPRRPVLDELRQLEYSNMEYYDTLRDRFDKDGFVIIRQLLETPALTELQSQIDRYVRDIVPTLPRDAA